MSLASLHARYSERVKPLSSDPITVQVFSKGVIDIHHAFDISLKGVGVRAPNRYQIDGSLENIRLVITLPGSRSFSAEGVVRHVTKRPYKQLCFGVEYTDISDFALSFIRDYIQHRKELPEVKAG